MKHINARIEGGLGTITLKRPPVNVLNIEMMDEINDILKAWVEKRDLKVVLFDAEGKCFSAGVDVGEHMGDLAPKMIDSFHGMFRLMDRLGAVTVSSVFGSVWAVDVSWQSSVTWSLQMRRQNSGNPRFRLVCYHPLQRR